MMNSSGSRHDKSCHDGSWYGKTGRGLIGVVAVVIGSVIATVSNPVAAVGEPVISEVSIPAEIGPGQTLVMTWRVQSAVGLAPVTAVIDGVVTVVPGTWAKVGGANGYVTWCDFPVHPTLVSGGPTDGRYQATCTLPAVLPNGEYSVWIDTLDNNDQRSSNNGLDTFMVVGASTDVSPPQVSNVVVNPTNATPGAGVTISWTATDETGVASIGPWAWGPNGLLTDDAGTLWLGYDVGRLVSGTATNGRYEVSLPLSATAAPGTYAVWFSVSDVVGNREAQLGPGTVSTGFATFAVGATSTDIVGIPTNVSAQSQGSQTARVVFTPPPTGRSAVSDFDVRYSTDASFSTSVFVEGGTSTTSWMDVPGLTPGTTYYFQVRAANRSGDGSWSKASTGFRMASPPGAPTSLVATRLSSGSARVSFAPGADGGSPIVDYDLQYSTSRTFSSGVVFVEAGTSAVPRIDVTRLSPRVTYYVRVRATNAAGDGPWSVAITVRV